MLQPKKTKFRRAQKGSAKGNAQRGNQLTSDLLDKVVRYKMDHRTTD